MESPKKAEVPVQFKDLLQVAKECLEALQNFNLCSETEIGREDDETRFGMVPVAYQDKLRVKLYDAIAAAEKAS
jgi:hypothetical protein